MLPEQSERIAALAQRAKSGAQWFYWIAALSLITSLIMLSGSNWRFFLSLGSTQLFTDIVRGAADDLGDASPVIAVVFDLLAAGLFAGLGFLAVKRHLWAYVSGMVLFGLDSLVFLLASDWIGIIFHIVVLYWIFLGFRACRQLLVLESEAAQTYEAGSAANVGATTPPPENAPPAQ